MIVTVANQKGGVGKTTTAVTLAHGLALRSYRVLLVDLDPQGQCASHLGLEPTCGVFDLLVSRLPARDVVRSTGRPGLWLLPGSKRTHTAETLLVIEGQGRETLARLLPERLNSQPRHYVILDTAPSAGELQAGALWAADLLLIPSATDYLSLEGVREVLKTVEALGRPALPRVRVLPTFYDEVTNESQANLARLSEAFGGCRCDSQRLLAPVHRAAVLRECPALGQTIFEHAPASRAAAEYGALVWEVLDVRT
ncbi:MAG: ParA family protein [Anaerolineales bacterium]|nr:ParA family protein [Anaerolineales bacterium]